MCKLNVYDFDIRIPFAVRGPRIKPGTTLSAINSNVDIVRPSIFALYIHSTYTLSFTLYKFIHMLSRSFLFYFSLFSIVFYPQNWFIFFLFFHQAPTILDLAGLSHSDLDGVSFAPLLTGSEEVSPAPTPYLSPISPLRPMTE